LPRGSRRLPDACLRLLERAELILHVGDFTVLPVLEELRALAPVEAVHGNMDEAVLKARLPERQVVRAGGLRIGLVHDPGRATGRAERLREWFPGCDVIAYGHTHAPEIARAGNVWIVNPGSPTERRRARGHTIVVLRGGEPGLVPLD
jgi:putative phosphoesterase